MAKPAECFFTLFSGEGASDFSLGGAPPYKKKSASFLIQERLMQNWD